MSQPPRRVGSIGPTAPQLYGFDIETDTSVDGLDPEVSPVVAVAITGEGFELVFDGDEAHILRQTASTFAKLTPGVIVTWNGGGFDLPFIADRAQRLGIDLGLRVALDLCIPGHHEPLPGHVGAYRGEWYGHRHLDGYQLFRADVGVTLGVSCGLKPLAKLAGLPVVEVDRERIHELSESERREYVASDAHLARTLVARRPGALRAVDQMPASMG